MTGPRDARQVAEDGPFSRELLAMFSLEGRVALVTGASGGIGRRFCQVLDGLGATVLATARREAHLRSLVGGLRNGVALPADLSSGEEVDALANDCLTRHGAIDIIVNCAGAFNMQPAVDESCDVWKNLLSINLLGPVRLLQRLVGPMLEQGSGSIINVVSIFGIVGCGQMPQAAYSASKGAMIAATHEWAAQWARQGVRVNAIAPGFIRTDMTEDFGIDEHSLQWLRRKTPMGRPGNVGDLDGALAFLATDASRYVTGQVLAVDGGWTAV